MRTLRKSDMNWVENIHTHNTKSNISDLLEKMQKFLINTHL